LTPEQAVDRLEHLHAAASSALRDALARYTQSGVVPTAEERLRFRYPELRVDWQPSGAVRFTRRAWARFEEPGLYTTTVTQPAFFRQYLLEQLRPLAEEFGATIEVASSEQEIPYPFVTEAGDEFIHGDLSVTELARHFPTPVLANVGDEIADGTGARSAAIVLPVRRAARRLPPADPLYRTDWHHPALILLHQLPALRRSFPDGDGGAGARRRLYRAVLPAARSCGAATISAADAAVARAWHASDAGLQLGGRMAGGVTIVNIGVGPSNAKTATDHLAVLRPHCWLMIGHCGGLRQSQTIGDYVLAHGYMRRDRILDDLVPPEVPVPALAEVQVALQQAAERVTGERGDALKRRLRTGTVVSYDDRNWELRWTQERRRINQGRAIAVDMESATLATQGYRLRVPYGTLLCVSDKPLHGEIKLPGAATRFYQRAVGEHLQIGLETVDLLRGELASLHSRKLRSFDEPPFR
jgi:AMP nucleosidase